MIAVLWIHIGSAVSSADTWFLIHSRSIASLAVPLFFLISGYLMAASSDLKKRTIYLIKVYLMMAITTTIFTQLFIEHKSLLDNVKAIMLIGSDNVGYLWFIKSLIAYRLIMLVLQKFNKESTQVTMAVVLLWSAMVFKPFIREALYTPLTFCSIGFLVNKLQVEKLVRVSDWFLLIPVLYFSVFTVGYSTYSNQVMILSVIVFLTALNSSLTTNPLDFYTRNNLKILYLHFFVIEIFNEFSLFVDNYFILNFLILLGVCSAIIYVYEKCIIYIKSR